MKKPHKKGNPKMVKLEEKIENETKIKLRK